MSSDAVPNPQPDPAGTDYRQRALLLADLGRYDEAAGELAEGLAAAPDDPGLLTALARVHLAAEQPAEALRAADRAAAAAPDTIGPMVARAMALADTRRFGEAARIAVDVLGRWPADAFAQRTGAALLSESRNGQDALNSAWTAVSLSPTDAEAHLVLAVVSARLRLFDLAQRAYSEALDLDPALADAQQDLGVVRLERRRWARALEQLADAASLAAGQGSTDTGSLDPDTSSPPPSTQNPSSQPSSPADPPWSGHPAGQDRPVDQRRRRFRDRPPVVPPPIVSRPSGPVLDPYDDSAASIRQTVIYGASATLVAALLTAIMATASSGASRVWAAMIGVVVLLALGIWLSRQLSEPLTSALRRVAQRDRRLTVAAYATVAAPLLIVVYAFVGGLIPLVAAMVVAAAAELLVLTARD